MAGPRLMEGSAADSPAAKPHAAGGSSVEGSGPELLVAERFRGDSRVAEARRLLADALAEYSAELSEVRRPLPGREAAYADLLAELGVARGGTPILPYLAAGLGNGPWVELADGSVKLDFISGIGVHGLGHSHPRMLQASIDGALEDVVMQGNLQQHPPSLWMCQRLLELSREGGAELEHCLLTTSGAMANENAIKLALHARSLGPGGPANRILAFENVFAGRSLALAALTDRAAYRQGLPLALEVDYLPFRDPADPQRSRERAVAEMHRLLSRFPGRYAAFWAEPMAGEGGYYEGDHEFFAALCQPLRDAGIPIIFDEIQTFARLSKPFAFQHYGLDRWVDIVTVGKITQVCATLYRGSLKPAAPILSQTFTGSSGSIAAGLAVLEHLQRSGCFGEDGQNVRRHAHVASALAALAEEFPRRVAGPFGAGMMIALTPGNGSAAAAKWLLDTMYAAGLIGFVCGGEPSRIRFLPPPGATDEQHLDLALQIVREAVAAMPEEHWAAPQA
ncbi:aminotransferase class III-fold pyridoxal phosphate-dependent enzyme [Candidatus Laterigemmans baculatus]|nr:aminotransferase class III-fold pyridoxal phosphate-dependent enzyme [Candidatus Laterigemmans baculatus]